MLQCLLVVALTQTGNVGTRNMSVLSEVPPRHVEVIMAVEAGRRRAAMEAHVAGTPDEYAYGYDCGDGWNDRGLAEAEVFGWRNRRRS